VRRDVLPTDHGKTAATLRQLAELTAAWGDVAEATGYARDCADMLARIHGPRTWRTCEARSLLGACLTRQGRFEDAERHLTESYSALLEWLANTDIDLTLHFSRILDLYAEWESRGTPPPDYREKIAALRAFRPPEQLHLANLGMAVALERRGEYAAAYRTLLEIMESAWLQPTVHARAGSVAASRYDRKRALRHVQKAVALAGDNAAVLNLAAGVQCQLGNLVEAVRLQRRAIEKYDGPDFRNNLGARFNRYEGHHDEAIRAFRSALAMDRWYALAQVNIGSVLLRLRRNREAAEAVREALAMKPLSLRVRTWAHAVLGCALFRSGEIEQGIEHLRRSTHSHIAIHLRPHVWLAEALAATGNVDEARSVLERRASDYPEDPAVWNALARFLVTTEGLGPDDRRAGLEHARKAVAISHRQGPVMLATLAEALFVNGRRAEAIAAAEEALQVMNGRDAAGLTLAEMNKRLEGYRARAGSAK